MTNVASDSLIFSSHGDAHEAATTGLLRWGGRSHTLTVNVLAEVYAIEVYERSPLEDDTMRAQPWVVFGLMVRGAGARCAWCVAGPWVWV